MARPFAGECRRCKEVGHLAADCPQKTATICKNCLKEGHLTSECKDARVLAWDELHPEWDAVMSWTKLVEADKEKDLDDFRLVRKPYDCGLGDNVNLFHVIYAGAEGIRFKSSNNICRGGSGPARG